MSFLFVCFQISSRVQYYIQSLYFLCFLQYVTTCLALFFMTLIVLRRNCQIFCRMSLILEGPRFSHCQIGAMGLRKTITGVKCLSNHIIARAHTININVSEDASLDINLNTVFTNVFHYELIFPLPKIFSLEASQ